MWIRKLMLTGVMLLLAGAASAHHSFAIFDATKQVDLSGTVKEFQFTNPHSWLALLVTNASGQTEEWTIEALSPNMLGRQGWKKSSIKAGDKVHIVIHPTRDGSKFGNLVSVTLPDGQTLPGGA